MVFGFLYVIIKWKCSFMSIDYWSMSYIMFLVMLLSLVGVLLIFVEMFEMMCEIEIMRCVVFSLLLVCLYCVVY